MKFRERHPVVNLHQFGDIGKTFPDPHSVTDRVEAEYPDRAGVRLHLPGGHFDRRRLALAVFTEKRINIAAEYGQVEPLQHSPAAVGLGDTGKFDYFIPAHNHRPFTEPARSGTG